MDAITTHARSTLAYALAAVAKEHSFTQYLAASFPQADKTGLKSNLIVCNWPLSLIEAYKATDIFWSSQMIETLKRTIRPVIFGNTGFARQNALALPLPLQGLFHEAGLNATLGMLLHDPEHRPYVILYSGRGVGRGEDELADIVYRTVRALDDYAASAPGGGQLREQLTARELDCIRWSAAGKSSDEIAVILNISIHTVNTHLKGAMRKLESANRTQAVATACRLRLI